MARDVVVRELNSLSVAPDGTAFRLGLRDQRGNDTGVVFPSDGLKTLILSLFRAGDMAFKPRLDDDSARLVYPACACSVEATPGTGRVMLIIRSDDGIEATFAIAANALRALTENAPFIRRRRRLTPEDVAQLNCDCHSGMKLKCIKTLLC